MYAIRSYYAKEWGGRGGTAMQSVIWGQEESKFDAPTGPFATGHFYGMTTHARGALHLEPDAVAVLDIGALHARAVAMDGHSYNFV